MFILILLLMWPTCGDTWWGGVDVFFESSRRNLQYSPNREGFGGERQKERDPSVGVLFGIPDVAAVVGKIFEHTIGSSAFQGNVSKLTVQETGRRSLPSWVFFDASTNTFLGVPTTHDEGTTSIDVTAHSAKHRVTTSFTIDVKPAHHLHPAWSRDAAAVPPRHTECDVEQRNDVICSWDEVVIYTTLLLDADVERLSAKQRVDVFVKLACYLSRDAHSITFTALRTRHNRVLVAGPGNVGIGGRRTNGAELSWISGCGDFSHSGDIAAMMEMNIRSGKVTDSIGFGVIGWYVWDDSPSPRRVKRRIKGTVMPTSTPRPTRLPSLTSVIDSRSSHVTESFVVSEIMAPSSVAIVSTFVAASPSASIVVTSSYVMPVVSSILSPVATSLSVQLGTLYTFASPTVTTPLTVQTTAFVGKSTSIPVASVSSLPIFSTRSTEVMTSSLIGSSVSSLPSVSSALLSPLVSTLSVKISATSTLSSLLIDDQDSIQTITSSLLMPSPSFSSTTSIDKTMSVSATPSLQFIPDSTFASDPVPSSSSAIDYVTSSAYIDASITVVSSIVATVPSLVISQMPSTLPMLATTATIQASSGVDIWTGIDSPHSSQVISPSSFELTSTDSQSFSTSDAAVMTQTVTPVSMATDTAVSTAVITEATSDLYSPTSSVLSPQRPHTSSSMDYLGTESSGVAFTYSPTSSLAAPLNTSVYSSFYQQQSNIITSFFLPSFVSSSDVAQSTVFIPTDTITLTGTQVSKSSLFELSSIDEFSSTSVVSSMTLAHPSHVTTVSTVQLTPSDVGTSYDATVTRSPSVPFDTFKPIQSTASTDFYPEFSLSLISTSFLEIFPSPSTLEMGLTEVVTPGLSISSTINILTSVLPWETSSLVVSLTTSALPMELSSVIASSSSYVTTVSTVKLTSSSAQETSTPPTIQHPKLINAIDRVAVQLGTYFEFPIPAETFYDVQDGDTTTLSLRLVTINNESLPSNSWIQLDAVRQVLCGLALAETELPSEYTLVASNSYGLTAIDAIQITVDSSILDGVSHRFVANFQLNYTDFMLAPLNNLMVIVKKLGVYYGDITSIDNYDNNYVTITSLSEGSVEMAWTNNSLSKTICQNDTIRELFARMSRNGSVNELFRKFMLPEIPVDSVLLEMTGICDGNDSSIPGGAAVNAIGSTDYNIWLVTVVPAVIVAVLVIVLIVVVIIRNNQRSQRGRYLPDSEKPIFGKNRRPVLMPEEMEMLDLGLRPKKPMMMPNDGHSYANAAFEHDLQPPPYQRGGSLPREIETSLPMYDTPGVYAQPPPTYRLPPPYVANTNDTVIL